MMLTGSRISLFKNRSLIQMIFLIFVSSLCDATLTYASVKSSSLGRNFYLLDILFPLAILSILFIVGSIAQFLTLKIKEFYYVDYLFVLYAFYIVSESIITDVSTPDLYFLFGESRGRNEMSFTYFMTIAICYCALNIFFDQKRKVVVVKQQPKSILFSILIILFSALGIEQFILISGGVYTPKILLFIAALIFCSNFISTKSVKHVVARFPRNFLLCAGIMATFYYTQQYLLYCSGSVCNEYIFNEYFLFNYLRFFGYALILYGVDYVIKKRSVEK